MAYLKSLALVFLALVFLIPSAASAEKRVALVIGNAAYEKSTRLTNPANDARELARSLEKIGFDKVTLKLDLKQTEFRRVLRAFSRDAAGSDVAMIYFAGHGIEVSGTNYIIPTDARLTHVDDVEFEAIELSKLMSSLNRAGKLKLVVLDACRNNPFKQNMKASGSTRSVGRGLARVNPSGSDTLVAYAAKEGTVAEDGSGNNSPFAAALIKHISTPGLDVRLLFGRVRDEVLRETGRRQEPFTYGSLGGDAIYLKPPEAADPVKVKQETDRLAWGFVKDTTDTSLLRRFIAQNPDNGFVAEARERIDRIEKDRAREFAALREEAMWNTVKRNPSMSLVVDYIKLYPNGRFVAEARERLAALNSAEAERKAEEIAMREKRKAERLAAEKERLKAETLRKETEAKRLADQRQASMLAAWKLASASNDPAVIAAFIAEYPQSPHAGDAQALLAKVRLQERQRLAALQPAPTTPKETPSGDTNTDANLGARELAREIQTRLNKAGCNAGRPDGTWGPNSRRALKAFARHSNVDLASLEPSTDLLEKLNRINSRVCPLVCGRRYNAVNGRCVLKSCPGGQELTRSGSCVVKRQQPQKKKNAAAPKPKKAVKRKNCGWCGKNNPGQSVYVCGVRYQNAKKRSNVICD